MSRENLVSSEEKTNAHQQKSALGNHFGRSPHLTPGESKEPRTRSWPGLGAAGAGLSSKVRGGQELDDLPPFVFLEGTIKVPGQNENAQESEPRMSHASVEGSAFVMAPEPQSLDIERSGSSTRSNSKALGPRTRQGKQKSSRNATKHGVFSKVIILETESKARYEELLAGLRETLQPEGAL